MSFTESAAVRQRLKNGHALFESDISRFPYLSEQRHGTVHHGRDIDIIPVFQRDIVKRISPQKRFLEIDRKQPAVSRYVGIFQIGEFDGIAVKEPFGKPSRHGDRIDQAGVSYGDRVTARNIDSAYDGEIVSVDPDRDQRYERFSDVLGNLFFQRFRRLYQRKPSDFYGTDQRSADKTVRRDDDLPHRKLRMLIYRDVELVSRRYLVWRSVRRMKFLQLFRKVSFIYRFGRFDRIVVRDGDRCKRICRAACQQRQKSRKCKEDDFFHRLTLRYILFSTS